MPEPILVQHKQQADNSNPSTDHILAMPDDQALTVGNWLVAVHNDRVESASNVWNTLTGWTKIGEAGNTTGDQRIAAYKRKIDGTEASSYTWTTSVGGNSIGFVAEISGADATDCIDDFVFTAYLANALQQTLPEVTSGVDECLILAVAGFEQPLAVPVAINTWAGGSEVTELARWGAQPSQWVGQKDLATAGGADDCIIDLDVSSKAVCVMIAIQPTQDSEAPNIDTVATPTKTQTSVGFSFNTNEGNGEAGAIITAAGDQSTPTNDEVVDGGAIETLWEVNNVAVTASGTVTLPLITGMTPGIQYGFSVCQRDAAGNSDAGSRISGLVTMLSGFTESEVYNGASIPENSILFVDSGIMTAADDASSPDRLTDDQKAFTPNALIGLKLLNFADSSDTIVTANGTDTMDGDLANGTDNSWDQGDGWQLHINAENLDVMWCKTPLVMTGGVGTLECYIQDVSASEYSAVYNVPVYASVPDGSYPVTLGVTGIPSLAALATGDGIGNLADELMRVYGKGVEGALAEHFSKTATESLQDAEKRWLIAQGATDGHIQEMWVEAFGATYGTTGYQSTIVAYFQSQ